MSTPVVTEGGLRLRAGRSGTCRALASSRTPPIRALLHHFDTAEQQKDASTLGMWLFLVTEIMFFGGLFTAYIVYRTLHPAGFVEASHELDITHGRHQHRRADLQQPDDGAGGARGADWAQRKSLVAFLILTIVLGAVFLGIKAVEYHEKFVNHHVPGPVLPLRRAGRRQRAVVLLALLRHDRPARRCT